MESIFIKMRMWNLVLTDMYSNRYLISGCGANKQIRICSLTTPFSLWFTEQVSHKTCKCTQKSFFTPRPDVVAGLALSNVHVHPQHRSTCCYHAHNTNLWLWCTSLTLQWGGVRQHHNTPLHPHLQLAHHCVAIHQITFITSD